MPSFVHELLVEMFTETTALADLLEVAHGVQVDPLAPAHPNFTALEPIELRGDAFFLVGDPGRPRRWLMLEVQTSIDKEKLRTLPLALEMARARFRGASGEIVLVTADEHVARYFDTHPFRFQGWLGTQRLLEVVRIDLSRLPTDVLLNRKRPLLSLLAVAACRKGPRAAPIARQALQFLREERTSLNARAIDVILHLLESHARKGLVSRMLFKGEYEYKSRFFRNAEAKGRSKGLSEGEAAGRIKEARAALVRVLKKRSFALSAARRRRIAAEKNLKQLERWLDSAITAASPADVFSDA